MHQQSTLSEQVEEGNNLQLLMSLITFGLPLGFHKILADGIPVFCSQKFSLKKGADEGQFTNRKFSISTIIV
jgi:hypothetical protein